MAVERKTLVFLTFFGCCASVALLATAAGTSYWVTATISSPQLGNKTAEIHFGLFEGVKDKFSAFVSTSYSIKLTCLPPEGVCMWSCGSSADFRLDDINDLYFGNGTDVSDTTICKPDFPTKTAGVGRARPPFLKKTEAQVTFADDAAADERGQERRPVTADTTPNAKSNHKIDVRDGTAVSTEDGEDATGLTQAPEVSNAAHEESSSKTEKLFMVYSLWVTTLVFLGGGMLFAVIGAIFAVVNTATNPVEAVTGVFGLYIWNGTAVAMDVLCEVMWAGQFHGHLVDNVAVRETIVRQYTTTSANLGYSFWLVFVSMVIHLTNVGLVFLAGRVKEETPVTIDFEADKTGGGIMIY